MSNIQQNNKLGIPTMVGLIIAATIGSGIFNLPGDMAKSGKPIIALIAWILSGVGFIFLTMCFNNFILRRPHLEGGLFNYVKEGLGGLTGCLTGWGHWISAWIGNIAYLFLLFEAIGYFIPIFKSSETGMSSATLMGSSCLIWLSYLLALYGVKTMTLLQLIISILKYIPFALFILTCITFFRLDIFINNMSWNISSMGWDETISQLSSSFMICLWAFLGVEGAATISSHAKKRNHVAVATSLAIGTILLTYILICVVPLGVFSQDALKEMNNPAMAAILNELLGSWGGTLVNLTVIMSITGAYLGWLVISTEILYAGAKLEKIFPKIFGSENKYQAASGSLLITTLFIQGFVLLCANDQEPYRISLLLSGAACILPYFLVALSDFILIVKRNGYSTSESISKDLIIAGIAVLFGCSLIYFGAYNEELKMQWLVFLYLPGIALYYISQLEIVTDFVNKQLQK